MIAKAASDKKAADIVIIDMRKMSSLGDFFVIASAESAPQIKAISENIIDKLKSRGVRPYHIESDISGPMWLLMDYGDVVAHIFREETRKRYNLERLWGDAPQRRFRPKMSVKEGHAKRKRKKDGKPKKRRGRAS